jgi:hypothetical protein
MQQSMWRIVGTLLLVVPFATAIGPETTPSLDISSPGTASSGCSNSDGPAVNLVFQIASKQPAGPDFTGPPVGKQQLTIRVNATFSNVRFLRRWSIGNPDAHGGLLAFVCPPDFVHCDNATKGTVAFTRTSESTIEGEWDLAVHSGRRIAGPFSAAIPTTERWRGCVWR